LGAGVNAGEVDCDGHVPGGCAVARAVVHSRLENPGTAVFVLTGDPVQGSSGCGGGDRTCGGEAGAGEELNQIPRGSEQVLRDLGGEINQVGLPLLGVYVGEDGGVGCAKDFAGVALGAEEEY